VAANPTVKVCVHPQDLDGLVGYDNLNHPLKEKFPSSSDSRESHNANTLCAFVCVF